MVEEHLFSVKTYSLCPWTLWDEGTWNYWCKEYIVGNFFNKLLPCFILLYERQCHSQQAIFMSGNLLPFVGCHFPDTKNFENHQHFVVPNISQITFDHQIMVEIISFCTEHLLFNEVLSFIRRGIGLVQWFSRMLGDNIFGRCLIQITFFCHLVHFWNVSVCTSNKLHSHLFWLHFNV